MSGTESEHNGIGWNLMEKNGMEYTRQGHYIMESKGGRKGNPFVVV